MRCVCFAPTGKYIASCSFDGTVRVWDATTGEPVGSPLTGHNGYVPALSCSACSESRVFANYSAMRSAVMCVGFDPSGKKLVSGSSDKTVKVWSVGSSGTFECESTLTGHRYVPSPCIECLLL